MITNYTQLTGKYLKANRRRTILTIIGIILSVSLISSIGFFIKGLQDAEVENVKNSTGSCHMMFTKNITPDLLAKVSNNPKVARSGLYSIGKTFHINEKLTLVENVATNEALKLLPYRIKQGKFPEAPNEIAVEKWILLYIDQKAKVGDTISLEGQKYVLAGILEDQVRNQIKNQGILLTKSKDIDLNRAVLLVEFKPKVKIAQALKELEALTTKDSYVENEQLLRVLGVRKGGQPLGGEYTVIGVIIAIVVIATIAVIYNSFQISVVERVKQFGLLRTIGTTPKQVRKIVFKEATVLALIGIPIGLFFGIVAILGISYVFTLLIHETVLIAKTAITLKIILLSIGLGLLSIYASALIPAIFAGRISPLVAVSSRALITKEKIKRRKNRLVGKIFGFEAELASKNIKRNPKRYRVTIFSIIISVVLFVTFTSFVNMVLNVTENYNESGKLHFTIYCDNRDSTSTIDEATIEQIQAIPVVKQVYQGYRSFYFGSVINRDSEIPAIQQMKDIYKSVTWKNTQHTFLSASLNIYDKDSLEVSKNYLQSGSIDIAKLNQENGVIIIGKNEFYNSSTRKGFFGPIANLQVGDEIWLERMTPQEEGMMRPGKAVTIKGDGPVQFGQGEVFKVKVLAVLKEDPFNFAGLANGLKMVTTGEVAKRLSGTKDLRPSELKIVLNDVKDEDAAKGEIVKIIQKNPSLKVVNYIDSNRQTKSAILMIQILLYGFVIVVSCIGCVNIINTITTNMILRKREFAMLKSIGITQKGLRKMIVLEGLLYGFIGTIYGSVIACGLSYLMYRGLMDLREQIWRIPWSTIGIAGAAALAIGYLSVLAPLKRIKKENLMDVVREDY